MSLRVPVIPATAVTTAAAAVDPEGGVNETEHSDNGNVPEEGVGFGRGDTVSVAGQGRARKKLYVLRKINQQFSKRFQVGHTVYTFRLNFNEQFKSMKNVLETLYRVFEQLITEISEKFDGRDLVRMTFDSRDIDYPVYIHFNTVSDLSVRDILSEIERVLQSFSVFNLNNDVIISVIHVKVPIGSGCDSIYHLFTKKRCVIHVSNNDRSCAARALVIGKALADADGDRNDDEFKRFCSSGEEQSDLARKLCGDAGFPFDTPVELSDFDDLSRPLHGYRVIIVSQNHLNSIVYDNKMVSTKVISLYHRNNHYDVLTSLPGFFGRAHFCYKCYASTNSYFQHSCKYTCKLCRHIHDVEYGDEVEWILCVKCNRSFKGRKCFDLHLVKAKSLKGSVKSKGKGRKDFKKRKSVCETMFKCSVCALVMKRVNPARVRKGLSKRHVCYMKKCNVCYVEYNVLNNHVCYIQPAKSVDDGRKDSNNTAVNKFIFFDIECCQDTSLHTPILCVAERVCQVCIKSGEAASEFDVSSSCANCGVHQHVFYGTDCIKSFCDWLICDEHKNSRVMCHNFRGYDSYFILEKIYELTVKPEVIYNGGKVMSLKIPKYDIRFIDSLNFMPMALSKIPSTFDLQELRKGFFPHLYNTLGNQDIDRPYLPPPYFYVPGTMSPSENDRFNKWYKENFNAGFNLKRELISYCISDVYILRRGSLKFRDIFFSVSGVEKIDPFAGCLTIAAACNLIFRTMFLKKDTIPVIAHAQPYDNHSIRSIEWLTYVERAEGVKLRHARSPKGEYLVKGIKVDGYHPAKRTVYQFHGCFIHGHPECYPGGVFNQLMGKSMGVLHANTVRRDNEIVSSGFELVVMWSCEFDRVKKEREYLDLMSDVYFVEPLQPRDAFYGGRVDTMYTYNKCFENERIDYYDFTSLYPYVNKYCKYPVGEHKTKTSAEWGDNVDITCIEGLIKCCVLPPRRLFHPVLPVRYKGKLYFSLCQSCVITSDNIYNSTREKEDYITAFYGFFNGDKYKCSHSEKERMVTGTWVSDELREAVNMGYKIVKIYESWCYETMSVYDVGRGEGGLFSEYINTFLKIKQEKSGWPDWVHSAEEKLSYIESYYTREGIRLNADKIEVNPGLRAVSKLMLNSFWGKFGQRQDLMKSRYFTDPAEYFKMLNDKRIKVCNVQLVNEEMIFMEYREKNEFVRPNNRINVVIAAYTTAHARLKLYSVLKCLGERVLYCDTDSIIFKSEKSPNVQQYIPPLGDFLGELTSELKPQTYICEFASTGPKSYAYRTRHVNGKIADVVCKVKGVSLNHSISQKINFECIRGMVLDELKARCEREVITPLTRTVKNDHFITREKKSVTIRTIEHLKTFQCVYSKRYVLFDVTTVPFGY